MAGPALPIGAHLQVPGQADYVTDDGDVRGGVHIVPDTTARDAIPAAMRKQGLVAHLYDGSEYQLGADLTTWTNISASLTGIQSVTGLAGIKALSSATTGALIRVWRDGGQTDAELWQKQPAGTATADDITVVTVTDATCQFHRIIGSGPIAKWREQAAWYVDGASGSDWDTGASGHAIKSFVEYLRRLGASPILKQTTTVYFLASDPNALVDASKILVADGFMLILQGVPIATQSYPVNTFLREDIPNGKSPRITATGIADWTSLIGKQLYIDTGTQKAVSWVTCASPFGEGNSTAECGPFYLYGAYGSFGTWGLAAFVPQNGQTLQVRTVPSLGKGVFTDTSALGTTAVPIEIRDLFFENCEALMSQYNSYCMFKGCKFHVLNSVGVDAYAESAFLGCCVQLTVPNEACAAFVGYNLSVIGVAGAPPAIYTSRQNVGVFYYAVFRNVIPSFYACGQSGGLGDALIFGAQPFVAEQSPLEIAGAVYNEMPWHPSFAAEIILFAGAKLYGAGYQAQGGGDGTIPWKNADGSANVPRAFGHGDVVVTLVAGQKDVLIPCLPYGTIIKLSRAARGGDIGELYYENLVIQSPTGGLRVRSESPTDTSTVVVSWSSIWRSWGGIFTRSTGTDGADFVT